MSEFFFREKEPVRENAEMAARALEKAVRYINKQGFRYVLVSGGSREISKSLFASAWHKYFPKRALPDILEINAEGNKLLYKENIDPGSRLAAVTEWMKANLPEVFNLDEVAVLDEYINSGDKLNGLRSIFKKLGIKKFSYVAFASSFKAHLKNGDKEVYVGEPENESLINYFSELSRHVQGQPSSKDMFYDNDQKSGSPEPSRYKDMAEEEIANILNKLE